MQNHISSDLAIEIQHLNKTYKNGVQAITDISLEVKKGEFFALLGANGAGKTTTISILTDLVRKTSGSVKIFGIDIDQDFTSAKYQVGVVPQELNFDIFTKVIDIVTSQAGYYGIPYQEALPRAKEVLTKLGLADKMNMQAMTLSGGMKRRLMIARALVHKPKLLILDEPTAGVDAQLRIGMWEYLKQINQEEGVTIPLTTHYLEEVEQLCERAAIINQGKIVKLDTVYNLINSLDSESYIIDVKSTPDNLSTLIKNGSKYNLTIIDKNSLEAILNSKESLNDLIKYMDSLGIIINSIRPKGNRLETLFLDIIG